MTPLESWAETTADALVKPTEKECDGAVDFDILRLRLKIALIQARALECRHEATLLLVHCPPTIRDIANGLNQRSHDLEQLGMKLAGVDKVVEMPARRENDVI